MQYSCITEAIPQQNLTWTTRILGRNFHSIFQKRGKAVSIRLADKKKYGPANFYALLIHKISRAQA